MEFLRSFLPRHFAGKPVVALPNVGCFPRLRINTFFSKKVPRAFLKYFGEVILKIAFLMESPIIFVKRWEFFVSDNDIAVLSKTFYPSFFFNYVKAWSFAVLCRSSLPPSRSCLVTQRSSSTRERVAWRDKNGFEGDYYRGYFCLLGRTSSR